MASEGGLGGVTACLSCCSSKHGLELVAKQGVNMQFVLVLVPSRRTLTFLKYLS